MPRFELGPHEPSPEHQIPIVGVLGIEPSSRAPEARILPVYYTPEGIWWSGVSCILPLYYIPMRQPIAAARYLEIVADFGESATEGGRP